MSNTKALENNFCLREISAFAPVRWNTQHPPHEKLGWLGRATEWLFDFYGDGYTIDQDQLYPDAILVKKDDRKANCKDVCKRIVLIACKLLLICTLIVPVICLIGKLIYRSQNTFVTKEQSDDLGPDPGYPIRPLRLIQDPKNRGNCFVNSALQMLMHLRTFLERVRTVAHPNTFIAAVNRFSTAYEDGDRSASIEAAREVRIEAANCGIITNPNVQDDADALIREMLHAVNLQPVNLFLFEEEGQGANKKFTALQDRRIATLLENHFAGAALLQEPPPLFVANAMILSENRKKLDATVELPDDGVIDLTMYVQNTGGKQLLYRLKAVVFHYGEIDKKDKSESADVGHYVATVLRGNQWYLCDDSSITAVNKPDHRKGVVFAFEPVDEDVDEDVDATEIRP